MYTIQISVKCESHGHEVNGRGRLAIAFRTLYPPSFDR